ncbi:MAG: carboxypeptidase regulatory-like domain-containing protein [Candidatus Accumulibacter sp.]|uniref:SdrD B-like domain-containing protein n=1 Tax=Accumulibacter sp. TaxID=2053492 RepID=UPI001AC7EBF0|nr:SdrD B-like domain-containing protein [Accumulibacter sp.]MBN8439229.1 carboxypeptidase regulatory-like domain-containing protein [Accumulibacter sp.]
MPAYQPPRLSFTFHSPGISPGNVHSDLTYDAPSYDNLEVSASDSAAYLTGWYDGWCVDEAALIVNGSNYVNATVYSSYEYNILRANAAFAGIGNDTNATLLPGENAIPEDGSSQPFLENLDLINWLLNNSVVSSTDFYDTIINGTPYVHVPYYTVTGVSGLFTYGDIQQSIYQLLGDGWSASPFIGSADQGRVATIVNEAITHEGYVPDVGEKIAVILDVRNSTGLFRQPQIIQSVSAKLGDYVWDDVNANGIQDDGSTGIDGATVNLWRDLNGNGSFDGGIELLATTTTGDDPHTAGVQTGYYEFKGLTPGLEYQVEFVKPSHLNGVSPATQGSDTQLDSNGVKQLSGQIYSEKIYLNPGEFNHSIDQGFYTDSNDNTAPRASLGDYVWIDANVNGLQDSDEVGVTGVTVVLTGGGADGKINGIGDTTISTVTGSNGYYEFADLAPGVEYQVQFIKPTGSFFTTPDVGSNGSDGIDSDANPADGKTGIVTLAPNEHNLTIDAGIYQTASLGDRLWVDTNGNGKQDDGATGISGQTITLIGGGADGKIVTTGDNTSTTTTTGTDGFYQFTDLTPGIEYQVQFSKPAGYTYTGQDLGGDDAQDSDANTSGLSQIVTLSSGENNPRIDAGVYQTASLGDKVWLDCNGNGVQDGGEVGVAGATVKLIGGGADGKIATTSDNTITTTTTSAASGHVGEYAFTGLTPGMEYQVQFVPLTGYSFTTKDAAAATDATDSDADLVTGKTQVVKLASGENNPTLDAGLTPDCRPVTFDFSGSSATDGTDGNSRTYTDALTGVSVTARAFSQSKLSDNTPTNTWQSAWLGAYSGGLGVTDSSEGTGSGNTHTVDNVGRNNYVVLQFSQSVKLDQAYLGYVVNDSDMKVWIGNSASTITTMDNSVLSSMSFSEVNTTTLSSARWADLNAGGVTGNVVIIAADTTDTSPEDYFKVEKVAVCAPDYCLPVAKASIGDFVWEDKNYNGVQDGGESGIANVTVKLLNSANTVLATTTTDSSGKYLFSNLNPGDYKVQVVAPSGYGVTKQDQGSDNAKDSDINSSGITALTTLSADEDDTSWDAGLFRKASVGDKVWEDWNHNNVQDVGEGGIGNIKVQLLNATGTSVLATTYTDSSGNYLFSNLNPGTYMLQFDKTNVSFSNSHWGGTYNMSDWKWAVKDAKISGVNNDAKDSDVAGDAISKTNVSKTDAFTLVSGQNDLTRDAGITPIVIDLDGNGIQTISRANSGGSFDLFGNGSAVASGWISGSDGFLAVDKNGNGTIDGISELFGGTAKGAGFAQLAAYDSNNDGLVNTSDVGFADLSIWRDVNGNHQTDAGELVSLALAGVSELVTGYTELPFLDHQGNIHLERSTATLSDGQTVSMTDVYFNVSADDAAAAGVALPGIAELLNELASCQVPVTDAGWLFA